MGMLSYPFWFFFEWLAPLVETFGIFYFLLMALLGQIHWSFFMLLLLFVYVFALSFSTYSLLFEELTYHKYEKKREVLRLFLIAFVEPFLYHPLIVWFAIKGNWDFFVNRQRAWGNMERKGFESK